jgi:hypothetical protein
LTFRTLFFWLRVINSWLWLRLWFWLWFWFRLWLGLRFRFRFRLRFGLRLWICNAVTLLVVCAIFATRSFTRRAVFKTNWIFAVT